MTPFLSRGLSAVRSISRNMSCVPRGVSDSVGRGEERCSLSLDWKPGVSGHVLGPVGIVEFEEAGSSEIDSDRVSDDAGMARGFEAGRPLEDSRVVEGFPWAMFAS